MSTPPFSNILPRIQKSRDRWPVVAACKVRLAAGGKGKRGGARVLYLHLRDHNILYLLYVFTKGSADNLSAEGKRAIRDLARQIKDSHRV